MGDDGDGETYQIFLYVAKFSVSVQVLLMTGPDIPVYDRRAGASNRRKEPLLVVIEETTKCEVVTSQY